MAALQQPRYGILDIVGEHVPLQYVAHDIWQGPCPFHDSGAGQKALYVWGNQNRWQCMGTCHIGGNADEFLAKVRGAGNKSCYQCQSPHMRRALMTPDEERFGMDMWHCDICGCFQNRRGD